MADGTQPVRPRLFEADLPKDPRKPIRHPFDAVPYTRPENVLDEPGMLRAVRAAPDHCLYWPANTVNPSSVRPHGGAWLAPGQRDRHGRTDR